MTKTSIAEKILYIDRRIIWIIFLIAIVIPIVIPIKLDIEIRDGTVALIDTIKDLPDGSVVFYNTDYTPLGHQEVTPENIALTRLLIKKNIKTVWACFTTPEGALWPPFIFRRLAKEVDEADYKYGEDYVFLGYFPGGDISVASFSANIRSIVNVDFFNTPLDEIPLMEDLNIITDFDLCIITGSAGLRSILGQMQAPYDMPMVFATMGTDYTSMIRFYQAGQILGLCSGLPGAAEIELLLDTPGEGLSSMGLISIGHLTTVLFIISCNILFIIRKFEVK